MKVELEKYDVHVKTILMEGSTCKKTGENDLHKLRVNDYGHYEGTICLVNG